MRKDLLTGALTILLISLLALPVASKQVVLRVWNWWDPNLPGHSAWFQWVEQEFEKANPDIDVQHVFFSWGEYLDQLSTSMVTGNPPDVLQVPVGWGRELYEKGALLNLSGFVSRSSEHHLRNYVPVAKHYVTATGAQFGVPFVFEATTLVYNRLHTQEAGIHADGPRAILNWNDFTAIAKKLTKRESDHITRSGYAFWMGLEVFSSWLAGNGMQLYSVDHTTTGISSKAAVETLTFLCDLVRHHQVFSESAADFYAGQAAMYSLGTWSGLSIERDAPELSFGMAAFPPGPSSKSRGLVGWTNMLSIPKLVANSDAAWRHVAFCTNAKAQSQLVALGAKAAPARLDYYSSSLHDKLVKERRWMLILSEAADKASPIIFYRSSKINMAANQVFAAAMTGKLTPTTALTTLNDEINAIWK